MGRSIFDQLNDSGELKVISCDACHKSNVEVVLYELDDEAYCKKCLMEMEWEEETRLTLVERNL